MDHEFQDEARLFVEDLLRTGMTLADVLARVLDELPEDAFPGEEPAEVLVEMVAGSVRPVIDAAGPEAVQQTRQLMGAVYDRTMSDLREAARLAGERSRAS